MSTATGMELSLRRRYFKRDMAEEARVHNCGAKCIRRGWNLFSVELISLETVGQSENCTATASQDRWFY